MVQVVALTQPVQCPFCKEELTEKQFLKPLTSSDDAVMIGGKTPRFECDRCHIMYGVEE